jgi:predicted TPR repeat methyltransferase
LTTEAENNTAEDASGFQEALLSHAAGDLMKAVEFYQTMPISSPDYLEGQHYLGIALHHLGQHELAVDILTRTLERAGERADWLSNFGNVLAAQGKFDAAVECFEKVKALAPDDVMSWINLGSVYEQAGNDQAAEQAYLMAAEIDPSCQPAYRLLSTLYGRLGRSADAVHAYCQSYVLSPLEETTPFLLGKAYYVLGRLEEAADVYARWKEQEPENPIPVHMHAACSNLNVPDRCSDAFINQTFDEYAPDFDNKLHQLAYRGPALLQGVLDELALNTPSLDILDAGCGTGLCCAALRPLAQRLVGVDLSQAMLAFAKERGGYDELHCQEIGAFLKQSSHRYDLIACIDTLIYFGALEEIMAQLATALKPGGRLIFTTEVSETHIKNFRLQASGRYAHARDYLHTVLNVNKMSVEIEQQSMLRMELDKPVNGYIIVAKLQT